jgi:succinoglycan biosynthesis transport protein ExoP
MKDFKHLSAVDFLRIWWRRRWYFLTVGLMISLGVSAYALKRKNQYRSVTRIVVESATLLDDPLSPYGFKDRTEERIGAIRQLLESRSIMERIVEEFYIGSNTNLSIPSEDLLADISQNLEITKAAGNTFTMSYTASDPQVAQKISGRLSEIMLEANQNSLKSRAIDKDQFLEQELQLAELKLAAADEKIRQFKMNHLAELPEQSTNNLNFINGLQTQLTAVENALDRGREQQKSLEFRIQEQKRLSAAVKSISAKDKLAIPETSAREAPSPLTVQLAARRAQLAEYSARYKPGHPDLDRVAREVEDLEKQLKLKDAAQGAAAAATGTVSAGQAANRSTTEPPNAMGTAQLELTAEAEIAQAQFELTSLKETMGRREKERAELLKSMETYRRRLSLAPALEQELLALTRERTAIQTQYDNINQRKFNAQISMNAVTDKKNETYRILDKANLPGKPVPPTRLQLVLIGIALGLFAGLAAAFVREYFEPSLANEEEAAAVLQIPILVSIPDIADRPRALLSR